METKLSSIPRRIVITALAVVMAVGLASTWAFAANTASADEPSQAYGRGYTQATGDEVGADASIEGVKSAIEAIFKTDTATVAEAVAVQYGPEASGDSAVPAGQVQLTLKGMHEAQLNSCKLYTYTNGQKGETNLLEGVEQEDSPDGGNQKMYVTTVDAGDYWVEGYDANNDYNGGIAISVVAGQENVIKLQRAYQIYATNSKTVEGQSVKWEFGTDYTVDYVVKDADGNVHATEFGQANSWGTVYKSSLFIAGGTINATFIPAGEFANEYMSISVAKSATQTTSSQSISASIPKALNITINAPAGSTISVGNMATYYVYTWFDGTVTKDDSTGVSETFKVPASMTGNRFYRVQNPNGVTYWNYAQNWSSDATIEVTADDLHIDSADFTKDTVYRFEKNVLDRADIYLNINQQGYKNMQVGETFELNVFRNWMAIENFFNSKVALPDMHYTVVDTQGNASDVVSITPDENNSSVATMTANKAGTAIVMVTYDAMTHKNGYNYNASLTTDATAFSAIWPECTGMFIVNVGEDGSSIQTNMMIDRVDTASTAIDAEHDILFYLGNEGASYSFTPESGTTVTVDRSVVTDKMTFNGFTSEGVTTDAETGEVTVSGLTTGRHIIKVEKNGVANYQVVTARQTSYEVLDAEGNEIEDLTTIKAGDTIQLQFSNLIMPCEKLSGIYNMNASIYYQGEDGTIFKSNPGSSFGVYDFSGNPARQLISLTIPKYWDGDTYSLAGAIKMGGFMTYNPGGHRGVTYAAGVNPNYNAPEANTVLSSMPSILIPLAHTDFITGTLNFVDDSGNTIDASAIDEVLMADSDGNEVYVKEDGTFSALANTYSYSVYAGGYRYTTGELEVTDGGTNVFNVTLVKAPATAWDGQSTSQPEQDEDGVYQIKTGAELAWINEQSNLSKDSISNFSLELTADIDLADYPCATAINASNGIQFEGNGHTVFGINSEKGFINAAGAGSNITNLNTAGKVGGADKTSVGGIVNTFNGNEISNCSSTVTIDSDVTQYYGGIVATLGSGAAISKCSFDGSIAATAANNVGGIVGYASGACDIVNCYNTGAISGSSSVGGVVGSLASGSKVTACYNQGSVEGTSKVGGFVGSASGATFANCYSAGTVTGGNQFVGSNSSNSFEKCYALSGEGLTDEAAELLSDADLKSADLATWYFAPTCSGYPALLWQTNVTFHEASGEGTEVAPTCMSKGYTSYTCSKCNGIFKSNYTESAGHTAGNDMVMHPTYCEYTCTVCNEKIKEYIDPSVVALSFPDEGVSNVSIATTGDYPWVATSDGMQSSCQGVNYGDSNTTLKFNLDYGGTIVFGYGVSSESNYDKLYITLNNPDGTSTTVCDAISGESTGNFTSGDLAAGQYTLNLRYKKDSSGDRGSDKGWISNFVVTSNSEDDAVQAVIDAIDAIDDPVTLDSETGIVAARAAYDGLPAATKAKVTNYNDLVKAEAALAELKAPEADKEAIANAISAISSIGTPVTLDKADDVEAARATYDALTDAQKTSVTNYSTLLEAEATIDQLNQDAADAVAKKIFSIGKVRAGVSDAAIADARAAYDGLTDYQKTLVSNYSVLTDSEAALDSAYAKQVYDKIDAIGEVTLDSKDAIADARAAYDALTDAQKEQVSNYPVLEAAEVAYYDLTVPVIETESLDSAFIGTAYEAHIAVSGTPAPSVKVSNLPDGLTYDAESGTISGTPTKVGTFLVNVEATNDTGTSTGTLALSVYNKSVVRIAGSTRLDTMSQIVEKSVSDGSQSDIILTSAWGYADALSASGLAGVYGAALVTTDTDSLSYAAKQQISRISDGSANVHVLGGIKSVSDDVIAELEAMPCVGEVDRISGADRVGTGMAIYEAGLDEWGDTCVIANVWNYADALSIAAFCTNNKAPIFGATDGTITAEQADAIKAGGFTKIVIVGGTKSVDPDAVQAALGDTDEDTSSFEYIVLAGDTRFETSEAIVNWSCGKTVGAPFLPEVTLDSSNACFTYAWGYADALAGINMSLAYNMPVLLVDETDVSKTAIESIAKTAIKCYILGGEAAVTSTVENWVSEAM